MSQPIRLALNGATGRMGRALVELVRADRRFRLARAVIDAGAERVGQPLSTPSTPETLRYSAGWDDAGELDAIVDFSTPDGFDAALDHAVAHGVALVVGTTGLDAGQERRLGEAAQRIAVLRAANFSLGVAVLTRLVREAAEALPEWDLEIVEAHHGRKEDAPSGTAMALGEAAAAARGIALDEAAVYAREGRTGPRRAGSIGFAVVRGGDIVGEHTVLLAGQGERVELGHRATDRRIFARGALESAAWLAGRAPGLYGIDDLLSERLQAR